MSVQLGICPKEPREAFHPYTSMHKKHNHTNVSLPLLNIPRNKNPSTHFSVQQKITTLISARGRRTAAGHRTKHSVHGA